MIGRENNPKVLKVKYTILKIMKYIMPLNRNEVERFGTLDT